MGMTQMQPERLRTSTAYRRDDEDEEEPIKFDIPHLSDQDISAGKIFHIYANISLFCLFLYAR